MSRPLLLSIAMSAIGGCLFSQPLLSATERTDHRLTSTQDESVEIYVRERLPEGADPASLDRAVLFVHGATYPGHKFDTEVGATPSWMAYTAESGYATYYLDKRGYGASTRPNAMQADPTSVDADAQGFFHALGSDTARYINIANGTHLINLEKHTPQLFAETLLFLDGE